MPKLEKWAKPVAPKEHLASMVAVVLQDVRLQISTIVAEEIRKILKDAAVEAAGSMAGASGKSAGDAVKVAAKELSAKIESLTSEIGEAIGRIAEAQRAAHDNLRAVVAAESGATRKSFPRAEKVDLAPIVDAVRDAIRAIPVPVIPKASEPKREWTFHVERDSRGFIKQIRAN